MHNQKKQTISSVKSLSVSRKFLKAIHSVHQGVVLWLMVWSSQGGCYSSQSHSFFSNFGWLYLLMWLYLLSFFIFVAHFSVVWSLSLFFLVLSFLVFTLFDPSCHNVMLCWFLYLLTLTSKYDRHLFEVTSDFIGALIYKCNVMCVIQCMKWYWTISKTMSRPLYKGRPTSSYPHSFSLLADWSFHGLQMGLHLGWVCAPNCVLRWVALHITT